MKYEMTKRNYIQCAYEIILQEGLESISIRKLADKLNCNTANLYRCFSNLDELILYVSLKYMKDYIQDLRISIDSGADSVESFFNSWECFIRYSYRYPEIFNHLFFGKYSYRLDAIMQEYYSYFPDEISEYNEEIRKIATNGNIFERGKFMVDHFVEQHILKEEDVTVINQVGIQIYKGYLKDMLDKRNMHLSEDELVDTYISTYRKVFDQFRNDKINKVSNK